ncbi:MAG: hypothetical protein H0V29_06225 [Thermoleophilaceae bacterium]|nr:hypothetical protein [Thermoleophilaceae bacterium]
MNRTLLAAAAALTLVIPAAAQAEIVPQKSIADVSLGASEADVRGALGKSPRVKTQTDDFSKVRTYTYGKTKVTFRQDEGGDYIVFAITTVSKSEKTDDGVGVGSTEAAVKKDVSRVKCETFARLRTCHVGAFRAGRVVTDFTIESGKVVRVTLGRVVD